MNRLADNGPCLARTRVTPRLSADRKKADLDCGRAVKFIVLFASAFTVSAICGLLKCVLYVERTDLGLDVFDDNFAIFIAGHSGLDEFNKRINWFTLRCVGSINKMSNKYPVLKLLPIIWKYFVGRSIFD